MAEGKHNVEWTVVEENIDEASLDKVANLDSSTYIFPAGRPPEDVDAQNAIIKQTVKINDGRILRASVGVKISAPEKIEGFSSCPGRCFCVIDGSSRRCETYYCNGNGYCWWVPCGMGC